MLRDTSLLGVVLGELAFAFGDFFFFVRVDFTLKVIISVKEALRVGVPCECSVVKGVLNSSFSG